MIPVQLLALVWLVSSIVGLAAWFVVWVVARLKRIAQLRSGENGSLREISFRGVMLGLLGMGKAACSFTIIVVAFKVDDIADRASINRLLLTLDNVMFTALGVYLVWAAWRVYQKIRAEHET